MGEGSFRRVASLREPGAFLDYLASLEISLPFDKKVVSGPEGPLSRPYTTRSGKTIGNRFAVLPMEGWDGTADGFPTVLTRRRWKNFGKSGAKLIWGGEAAAVTPEGRGNPRQLIIDSTTAVAMESLRMDLENAHEKEFGNREDLLVGLQLTHSGRFSRPGDNGRLKPVLAYHHPILDSLFSIPEDYPLITDDEIDVLTEDFIRAAVLARDIGFEFVDVKHCHGYFGHELLSASTREGKYGGSLANRSRFARTVIEGIRREAPDLMIGVRISAFDFPPFRADGPGGAGRPLFSKRDENYPPAFGADPENPLKIDLEEPIRFISMLEKLEVELICITAGSPYYNPHIQRPALFPPSDGYAPPEDPLAGVARQIKVTGALKKEFPSLLFAGSAYTYLQEWLPNVAQAVVREGKADVIGLGRMMLCYPELAKDILNGRPLDRKRICRTFSKCTTAPRKGLVSGCYPLDPFYKALPEADEVKRV